MTHIIISWILMAVSGWTISSEHIGVRIAGMMIAYCAGILALWNHP